MNGELKPVAIAFASIVLPVPGAPKRSRPRSRLPPARSNCSPDCQMSTTRRTSSFASVWPRTSSSFTPHSASPGSNDCICERFISSSGPNRIAKFAKKRKKTKTICIQSVGELRMVRSRPRCTRGVSSQVPPRKSQTIVIVITKRTAILNQKRQNQARRRPTTSSSRRSALSTPNRLGQGISLRKRSSAKPRKTIDDRERWRAAPATSASRSAGVNQTKSAGRGHDGDDRRDARQLAPAARELLGCLAVSEHARQRCTAVAIAAVYAAPRRRRCWHGVKRGPARVRRSLVGRAIASRHDTGDASHQRRARSSSSSSRTRRRRRSRTSRSSPATGFYDGLDLPPGDPGLHDPGRLPAAAPAPAGRATQFEDEFNEHQVRRGALAMANAGPNTNGSQFFIVTAEACPVARRQAHRLRPGHERAWTSSTGSRTSIATAATSRTTPVTIDRVEISLVGGRLQPSAGSWLGR